MSSLGPSREALSKIIQNEHVTPTISNRNRRQPRPTEKAQYIAAERDEHDRAHQQPRSKNPTKSRENNKAPPSGPQVSQSPFTSCQVDLRTHTTPTLTLKPQMGKCPPLPRKRWEDDELMQPSGFINSPLQNHGSRNEQSQPVRVTNSPLQTYGSRHGQSQLVRVTLPSAALHRRLTPARAAELLQQRTQSVAQELFPPESNINHSRMHSQGHVVSGGNQCTNNIEPGPQEFEYDHGHNRMDTPPSHQDHEDEDADDEIMGAISQGIKRVRSTESDTEDGHQLEEPSEKRPRSHAIHNDLDFDDSVEDNLDAEDEETAGWRNPKKIRATQGRAAARDYEPAVQQILKIATGLFRSRLTAEGAYPDRMAQIAWAKEAWLEACQMCEAQILFNDEIIQLITNRVWQLSGELKTKIRPLVETMYGFENSVKPAVVGRNRALVEDLKTDFGLCYQSLGNPDEDVPRSGLYEHRIIQKAINIAYYCNKKDEGVVYSQYFQPFPLRGVALMLTVIENCIDEWSEGERMDVHFSEPTYKDVYDKHVVNLRRFNAQTKEYGILPKMLKRLDANGRLNARVDVKVEASRQTLLPDDAIAAAIREYQERAGENSGDDDEFY
ncbi:hypothetical protein PAXINDRAFT_15242 [Paxillus involutus ATCC 200175]|uniref:DUF6532 domain-containing protein n=1 Tax=Paxillus involutus ATCC 200175 TaxID=664439 RepID=A0A0C9TX19_PAXIN|nr:hypothetical protein PAXINDRAFT_15242 [Paxillus involutus ATCC 200175]